MKKNGYQTTLSLSGTQVLKAIAILGVLLIHTLSSVQPSPFVNGSQFQLLVVTLDQLSRICVPLFVALSGYGLFWKYSQEKLSLKQFFKQRISKTLPLYVLWSAIFALLFYFVPTWDSATLQPNFIWKLILGRADYHLYFVPMIFQLYLLFPLLLNTFKKNPHLTFITAVLIQLIWWWFFSYQGLTVSSWKYFAGDGEQYIWCTNWIAYFVLGMYLPRIWQFFDSRALVFRSSVVLVILFAVLVILSSQNAIQTGLDPLYALKFTRYPLLIYSVLGVSVLSYFVAKKTTSNQQKNALLLYIGKISYPLYLGHTFFLRIIFNFLR